MRRVSGRVKDQDGKAVAELSNQMQPEVQSEPVLAHQAAGLQDSSQRIVAAQDEERHRLARDLHDGIQQHLVVLRMGFGMATEAAERTQETAALLSNAGDAP